MSREKYKNYLYKFIILNDFLYIVGGYPPGPRLCGLIGWLKSHSRRRAAVEIAINLANNRKFGE
jgi:hypothetical protein